MNNGYKLSNMKIFLMAFIFISFIPIYVYLFLRPKGEVIKKNSSSNSESTSDQEVKGVYDISKYPQIINSPNSSTRVGEKFDFYIKGVDSETSSDQLKYSIKEGPSWIYIYEDHIYGFPQENDKGTYKLIVSISDESLSTDKLFYIVVY